MRKIQLLLCTIALIFVSCTPSNEEKAEKLITEVLKGYLYHPDSYEPLYTSVDSMFIDVSVIDPIMKISNEISKLNSRIHYCEREIESAESSMDTWSSLYSQYERKRYARAKKEKEEAESYLNKYTEKLSNQIVTLKDNVSKYHKGEFSGWAVIHRFRCLDGEGSITITEMIFFCNKEFTTCGGYEADKFEDFIEILNTVDNATSDDDIMDLFKEHGFSF